MTITVVALLMRVIQIGSHGRSAASHRNNMLDTDILNTHDWPMADTAIDPHVVCNLEVPEHHLAVTDVLSVIVFMRQSAPSRSRAVPRFFSLAGRADRSGADGAAFAAPDQFHRIL
jgi:hypothetical protein